MEKDYSLLGNTFLQKIVSYKNQSIDLCCKSTGWFLYDTIFTERCFQSGFKFNSYYNFMQWWGVETREDDRTGKIIFIWGDNNPINCSLSRNNHACSLTSFVELIGKGATALYIQVIESFNLLNSIKLIV